MGPFRNILVLLDHESSATGGLWRACELAQRDGASVTAVAVLEPLPRRMRVLVGGGRAEELQDAAEAAAREHIERLVDRLPATLQVAVDVDVLSGRPFLEVVRRVLQGGHDLVVLEDQGGQRMRMTSTALHLVRKCPSPVWVIRAGASTEPGRVLAAVDVDDEEQPARSGLNHTIIDLASSAAGSAHAELHVVHAWHLAGESMLSSGRTRIPPDKIQELLADERERTRRALYELVGSADVDEQVHVHHRKGDAGEQVAAVVDDQGIDLLVLGTANTRAPGVLIGNTAETLIQSVPCSILAVKPPGFQTPVTLPDHDPDPDAAKTAA